MSKSKLQVKWKEDKSSFFKQPLNNDMNTAIKDAEELANDKDYLFILKNHALLIAEFKQLFAVLQKQKNEDEEKNRAFWVYCYYCATLLETFHKAYSQESQEAEYKKFKLKIKNYLLKVKEEAEAEETFIESVLNSFVNSFYNLITSPLHSSRIRDYLAYANLCRLHWVFTRLTLVSGFSLAKELNFLDQLDYSILGPNTNVDQVIDVLNSANHVLSYFSVGLFLGTFIIDAGTLIKHTFFPTDKEGKNTPEEIWARFKFEIVKRHGRNSNDLVWSTVNFITNFNKITGIPDPAALVITAVFLGFDVGLTLYKCHLAKKEYLLKKAQYDKEIEDIRVKAQLEKRALTKEEEHHIKILEQQILELEIDWRVKEQSFYFNASAAALLMIGFSASLLLSGPGIPLACFFICTVGVAMYRSSAAYTNFQEKSLRLEHATGKEYVAALKEYEAARNDFIFTMIKNTVMPIFLIATWATCWPAGIVLTALYLGYEAYHAYDQYCSKKAAQLALQGPIEEEVLLESDEEPLLDVNEKDLRTDSCCFI